MQLQNYLITIHLSLYMMDSGEFTVICFKSSKRELNERSLRCKLNNYRESQVLTAVVTKSSILWDIMPCSRSLKVN
jgi:hypothetical protein